MTNELERGGPDFSRRHTLSLGVTHMILHGRSFVKTT